MITIIINIAIIKLDWHVDSYYLNISNNTKIKI